MRTKTKGTMLIVLGIFAVLANMACMVTNIVIGRTDLLPLNIFGMIVGVVPIILGALMRRIR